jgi:hypothetical protein
MDENSVLHDGTGNPWRQREIFLNGHKEKGPDCKFSSLHLGKMCGKEGEGRSLGKRLRNFLMGFCLLACGKILPSMMYIHGGNNVPMIGALTLPGHQAEHHQKPPLPLVPAFPCFFS